MIVEQMLPLYKHLIGRNKLYLDLIAYPIPEDAKVLCNAYPRAVHSYENHFKIGGYKIVLDGSSQGKLLGCKHHINQTGN